MQKNNSIQNTPRTTQQPFIVALSLAGLLLSCTPSLHGQDIYIDHYFYRDYLDLGQNKGVFQAGIQNPTLDSIKTPGMKESFNFSMPDFSARSNNGNQTALDRGFVVTADHVPYTHDNMCGENPNRCTYGSTNYYQENSAINSGNYGRDVKFVRYNKYVVEGSAELLDTGITGKTQTTNPNQDSQAKTTQEQNLKKLNDRLEEMKDDTGNIIMMQAGQGNLSIFKPRSEGGYYVNGNRGEGDISAWDGFKGGSIASFKNQYGEIQMNRGQIIYDNMRSDVNNSGKRNQYGISITPFTWGQDSSIDNFRGFYNRGSSGDSGSGFFAYDAKHKKWVLFSVTTESAGNNTNTSFVAQSDYDDYRKQYEQSIDLSGGQNWNLNNKSVTQNGTTKQIEDNKDIFFQNGGTINVQSNITLNQTAQDQKDRKSGGFIFQAKEGADSANPTQYSVKNANGTTHTFDGAGIEVEKNARVEWNLGFGSNLHKIGEGELILKTYDGSTATNTQYNYLRLGEGKVVLDSDKKIFEGAYITSGRGTLELVKGKAQGFGATKDTSQLDSKIPHHFILNQDDKTKMGFTFGNGGGNLDLKGNSLTLNTIVSNDSRGNIINTETSQVSNVILEGKGYDTSNKKGQTAADTIIHASFGQNTQSAQNATNNLKIIYKNDTRPQDSGNTSDTSFKSGAALIFDGNLDIQGLESSNGNIVLQGHPTAHAYIPMDGDEEANKKKQELLDKITAAEGAKKPEWLDYTRPSMLEQPDWEERDFKVKKIDLKESHLSIGRAANVEGDITLDSNSKLALGGQVRHYIDKKDGNNLANNGFGYQQDVEQGNLSEESQKIANETIHYKGKISATGGNIESKILDFNANLDLKSGAKLKADYLTLEQRNGDTSAVASLDGSNTSAEVEHLNIKNVSNGAGLDIKNSATFKVTHSVVLEKSSNINLSNLTLNINDMLLKDSSSATMNSGTGNYNLFITGKSSLNNSGNDFLLSPGKQIILSKESTFKVGTTNGNGTLKIEGQKQNPNTQSTYTSNSATTLDSSPNLSNDYAITKPLDPHNTPEPDSETIIAVEKGSKLEIAKLQADKGANVYVAFDIESLDSQNPAITQKSSITQNPAAMQNSALASTQKNFNIEAKSGSHIYINTWDLHRESFTQNQTTSLTSDADSRIHFGTLQIDMAKATQTATPLDSNLAIYNMLNLQNVGKTQNGTNDNNRFHVLQLQNGTSGNNGTGGNKDLTFENGAKIHISLDSSVNENNAHTTATNTQSTQGAQNSTFELGKYYTLISAGSITDKRSDKRVNVSFANGQNPLFWATYVENNEMKIKFTKDDPSSYAELSKVISNDPLLDILIQHNPKNDFVQMAGTANQVGQLENYLASLDKSMNEIATHNTAIMSDRILYANNEAINTRIMQVKAMQPSQTKYKLAMSATNTAQESQSDASSFHELKVLLDSIEEARKINNAWVHVGGGYFGEQQTKGNLVFYGTNLGYDRLFNFGGNEYLIGAMAGIGGSNYMAGNIKDNSLFYNVGLYMATDFQKKHEVQSNMNLSYLDSNKFIQGQGNVRGDSMRNGTFGWLWSSYYKYKFDIGALGVFRQVVKPVGLMQFGFNGIGAVNGSFYKQKSYNDFNLALGVGAEYSIVKDNATYSIQTIARQAVYSSGKQLFVSLNNAQNFMGYDLQNEAFGFQLNFLGYNQFPYDLSLQYGISGLFDIKRNFGVKGDVRLQYKF